MIDNPANVAPRAQSPQEEEEEAEQIQDEELHNIQPGTPASSPPPVADLQVNSPATASRARGGPKRKKKGVKRRGNEKNFRKKLENLNENLKPIPFVPLDLQFSSHEKLLKQLGLWDFVHLDFDANLRTELIAQLIANYRDRCSYVKDSRINVSRADLARALKLPVKKEKDTVLEEEEAKESICFIEEFLSKWVLLHGEDDMWMMPPEVSNWTKAVKEGHFYKLDWASVIWFMVEKELKSAPKLGNCYYASHLQSLIKCQKEELLGEIEDLKMEVDEKDDVRDLELEEHNNESSLGGQEKVKDDVMDCEENDELEPDSCLSNRKGEGDSERILQRCNLGHVRDVDCEDVGKKEHGEELEEGVEVEEAHNGGYPTSLKGETLDAIASTNLLEGLESAQLPYSTGLQNLNNSSRDFLVSSVDTQSIPVGSSFFGNINHRGIGHENGTSLHSLNGNNKRMRSDDQWQEKPSCFDECIQDIQQLMGKARMLYAEKEQAHSESYMNQQLILEDLQNKQRLIDQLHKARYEEQNKRRMEVYRLERELYMMGNLLDGYRKALKKTHQDFAEYRAQCPQPEQSLYKDVKGSGGLVLSAAELEKQCLKQEAEERMNRFILQRKLEELEAGWSLTFEAHEQIVFALSDRLNGVKRDVKQLKEEFGNRKVSETPENLPNES